MTEFYSEDFTVASDTPLGDFTSPAYIDNNDLSLWEAVATDNTAHITAEGDRIAGPDVSPGTFYYQVSATVEFGGDTNNHRPGVVARWNGQAFADQAVRFYRLMVRGSSKDWVISRTVDGQTTWIKTGTDAGLTALGTSTVFGLRLRAQNVDSSTVRLIAYADTGSGFEELGYFDDTSADRIDDVWNIGIFSRRVGTKIHSLSGDTLEPEIDQRFYEDNFDNVSSNQTLNNRTDPNAYEDGNANWEIDSSTDEVGIVSDANRYNGPSDATPPSDGYIVAIKGFRFGSDMGASLNRFGVLSRWNGSLVGSQTGYLLRLDAQDGWRLIAYTAGTATHFPGSDTSFVSNNSITADSIIDLYLQTEDQGDGTTVINAWVAIDGDEPIQVATDLLDDNTDAITALGQPGFYAASTGNTFNRAYAGYLAETGLAITSVSPGVLRNGDSVTVTGTFPETITSVTVGGESQTIGSQDATSLTFTFALGDIAHGSKVLELGDGTNTASTVVFVEPVSGNAFVNVADLPWPSGQESVFENASPTVTNGMQAEYDATTDQGAAVTLNSDGTFEIDSITGPHEFDVRVHDGTEWGPYATFTVQVELSAAPVANAGANVRGRPNEQVTLDGSGSSDDVGITEVQWTWVSYPGDTEPEITGSTSLSAVFTPTVEGEYEAQLSVSDEDGQTQTDNVVVIVEAAKSGMNMSRKMFQRRRAIAKADD